MNDVLTFAECIVDLAKHGCLSPQSLKELEQIIKREKEE